MRKETTVGAVTLEKRKEQEGETRWQGRGMGSRYSEQDGGDLDAEGVGDYGMLIRRKSVTGTVFKSRSATAHRLRRAVWSHGRAQRVRTSRQAG